MWHRNQSARQAGPLLLVLLLGVSGCGGDVAARKAAHLQRGETYLAAGQPEHALVAFHNAVQLDPQDAGAYYKLALAYLNKGTAPDRDAAVRALTRKICASACCNSASRSSCRIVRRKTKNFRAFWVRAAIFCSSGLNAIGGVHMLISSRWEVYSALPPIKA